MSEQFTRCEKCRQPVTPDAPGVVKAVRLTPVDDTDGSELLDLDAPILFHEEHYPGDSERLRRV